MNDDIGGVVTADLIREIKAFIVENLEYDAGGKVFERRSFDVDVKPALSLPPFFGGAIAIPPQLKNMLGKRERSFSEELKYWVKRSGRKPAEVYSRAQINRQLYSKINKDPDYRPKKATALALAIALELTLEQTKEFIARAGYALTRSSVTDLVIEFFINRRIYDVMAINEVLEQLDEPVLGSVALEDTRVHLDVAASKAKAEAREARQNV